MHAYAISDPVFHAMHRLAQTETAGALGDFCVRCHSPIASALGEVGPETTSEAALSPIALAAISCEVCHRDVRLEHARDGKSRPGNARLSIAPGGPLVGGIPDPVANNFHSSRTDDTLEDPDFCGACHDVDNHRGVPVEKPRTEYVESVYPGRDIVCIDCHMQTYTGRATPDGPIRHQLRRHDFAGVDVALTPFPRRGFQEREIEAFLRTAAQLTVDAPRRVVAGDELAIVAHVKNVGAGHNLPTGPSTEREMWVEVTLSRADGAVVFASGRLDANRDLMNRHSELRPDGDPALALFTDHFVDAQGEEVPFLWQAARVVEGTIPPLETRVADYRVRVPDDAAGERLRLAVRLRFRAFPPHQLRRLGLGELVDDVPIFDIAEHESAGIEVVASLRTPGVIRVPADAPDLASAVDAARSGDTVIVDPGVWWLDEPLDFAGRDIVLRSRTGPTRTTIELAPRAAGGPNDAGPNDAGPNDAGPSDAGPSDAGPTGTVAGGERRSLFVLVGGESRAATIAGFTLRGGRGTLVDGERVGGAVVALESSPTIADCVFVANQALDERDRAGGFGGALFLRGGSALIADCRFESNRAGGRGGAICALGDAAPLIEGCEFTDNHALEGGAVAIGAAGRVLGCGLRANHALRGGALVVDAVASHDADARRPPRAVVVRESAFTGNSAARGGAVLVRGPLATRFERVILAGNIGGALGVESGSDIEVAHATIVENRLGPGPIDLDAGSRVRIVSSIVSDNQPATIAAEVAWSVVDDAAHVGETNRGELALFRPPFSRWERCLGRETGCVPILRPHVAASDLVADLEPASPHLYRRYVPGRLELLGTSACIDAGDPAAAPDADGTRADAGAIPRLRAAHLFVRGDVDGDGAITLLDAAAVAAQLGDATVFGCAEAADVDDDGRLGPDDAVALVRRVFGATPPGLPTPAPDCAPDARLIASLGCSEDLCKP